MVVDGRVDVNARRREGLHQCHGSDRGRGRACWRLQAAAVDRRLGLFFASGAAKIGGGEGQGIVLA